MAKYSIDVEGEQVSLLLNTEIKKGFCQVCQQSPAVRTRQTNAACNIAWAYAKHPKSFLHQLTECLCPIPFITYPQEVLMAIQRAPEQRKRGRNIARK